jgi:hypothetical protein
MGGYARTSRESKTTGRESKGSIIRILALVLLIAGRLVQATLSRVQDILGQHEVSRGESLHQRVVGLDDGGVLEERRSCSTGGARGRCAVTTTTGHGDIGGSLRVGRSTRGGGGSLAEAQTSACRAREWGIVVLSEGTLPTARTTAAERARPVWAREGRTAVPSRETDERRATATRWSIIGGGAHVGPVNLASGSTVGGEEILDELARLAMLVLILDAVGILLSLRRRVSDVRRRAGDESKGARTRRSRMSASWRELLCDNMVPAAAKAWSCDWMFCSWLRPWRPNPDLTGDQFEFASAAGAGTRARDGLGERSSSPPRC